MIMQRFEQLAHAHCPAGVSGLIHFVVEKVGLKRFLCCWLSYVTSILVFYLSRIHKKHL